MSGMLQESIPTRADWTMGWVSGLSRTDISDTDCVFWYTFGHNHIPRPEDIPVMPTAYVGWLMKPSGFFDENPANDVPPTPTTVRATLGVTECCAAKQ